MEIIMSIAGLLLGGTSVYTIIENIKYRRENKELKTLEVEKADLEAQEQKIDLGTKYQENMVKMMDELQKTYEAILKNGGDNAQIIKKIDALADELKEVKEEQRAIKEEQKAIKEEQKLQTIFLNGEYAAFRKMRLEEMAKAKKDSEKSSPDEEGGNSK